MSRVPACPACGAKFAHDRITLTCKKCGLPDEVARLGARAIARWKRKPLVTTITESGAILRTEDKSLSVRQRKLRRLGASGVIRRLNRNKHGRVGVKRRTWHG